MALIAFVPALAACGAGTTPADDIAFTRNVDGFGEIWVMRPDGSDERRLTEKAAQRIDAAGAVTPAWSPDRKQIAFAAQFEPVEDRRLTEIFVMSSDGNDMRPLTTNNDVDAEPSWSPDGNHLAFSRIAGPGTDTARGGIYTVDAYGDKEVRLTDVAWPTFDSTPSWSPDGSLIAFSRLTLVSDFEHLHPAIYVMRQDGGGLRKLAEDGREPEWSADGKRIVFTSLRDRFGRTCFEDCATNGEIYVINADGSGARRLTNSRADDRSPTWSPDGRRIAFVSDRADQQLHDNEIYAMDVDGHNVHRLTQSGDWSLDPNW